MTMTMTAGSHQLDHHSVHRQVHGSCTIRCTSRHWWTGVVEHVCLCPAQPRWVRGRRMGRSRSRNGKPVALVSRPATVWRLLQRMVVAMAQQAVAVARECLRERV
jgi:hypothetical protein